ncbi:MAG: ABC transporter permease [Myxococcales bacterium]|nr:ABC transporter permease [Myxococcales bacterium]
MAPGPARGPAGSRTGGADMSITELFRSFLRTFLAQRARAFLTLLGIMIGTGSIVMLAGLLESGKEALVRLNQGVNEKDTLRFHIDEPPQDQRDKATRPLSRRDGDALATAPLLGGVSVLAEGRRESKATYQGKEKRVRLMGVLPEAREMYRLEVARGRFIDDDDIRDGRRVAVIGHEVFTELFADIPEPLGAVLPIDGESFTVVGVMAHKPVSGHGTGTWMWDRRVVTARTAFDASFSPEHEAHGLFLKVEEQNPSEHRMDTVAKVAESLLLRLHLGVKNFSLDDRQGEQQERTILAVIQILLLATVVMSLFVGGINIMNIMLVTVTERTREIGVRRAVGASPRAIWGQFLFEAAAVSSVGGVLGVIGGVLFSWLVGLALASLFGAWNFRVEAWSILLGLLLAMGTGVVFGLFPALRASRLDPVEALRAE